jgi:DHA2 family multidrug resistance protein
MSGATATPAATGSPDSVARATPTTAVADAAAAWGSPDSVARATPTTATAVTAAPTLRGPGAAPARPVAHDASAPQVAPAAPAKPPHRILITITVMLASFMQTLDNTIANVALPRMQGSLSATQDQMTWVLTSYIVAAAIMTPLAGWLAGQIGRRRVFLASIIGFTIASAFCGLAQTLPEIIIARLLQGLCGAALVPMSQAVLLDINPPEKHARAMSIWVMAVTVGPILGPALGGWLTDNYNWRWVFYINVPFGILAAIGTISFLSETPLRKSRFDFFGFATLSLAIGAFQVMLDRGQLKDWFSSTEICITASFAAVSFYLLVVHTLTAKEGAFVSPGLFKDRNFLTGCVFMAVVGVTLFATLALLPPLLQDLMNYPVMLTGLVTAPRGFGTFGAMFIVQWMMRHKFDVRIIIALGMAITSVSLWQMTGFYLQMDHSMVVWSGLLQGLGSGMVYVPLASLAFATLAPAMRNEGTAIFSLVRNIGSSIGIAVVTTMLIRNTQLMHSRLAESITPYFDPWHPATSATAAGMAMVNHIVTNQATMIAYNNDFKMMMILTVCAIPLLVLMRAAKQAPGDADAPLVVE